MRFACLYCAALAGAAPALAQERTPAPEHRPPAAEEQTSTAHASAGEVILVLGDGLAATPAAPAYATLEIPRDRLVATASGRLEDALDSVAGFQQFRRSDSRSSNPSAQGVTLRALGGNATSRALVLLDGVPIADPFFGYIPFSAVAPERLAEVRVTRGGGQGAFGSGALAGTIELDSADAATLGPANGRALVNDRAERELSATVAPEVGDGFAVLSGRWDRGRGFYTTPADERVPATARARFDAWSASARAVQRVAPALELQLRGLAFADHRTLRFAGADNSSEGKDIALRLVGRGPWQLDALAYAQWRNFTNVVISSTRFTRVLDQKDTPSRGQGGKIELRPPVGERHALRIGADFRRSQGDLFEDAYSAFTGRRTEERFAGGTNFDLGLFVEDDWSPGKRLVLTGGLRADRYRIADGYYRALDGQTGAVIRDEAFATRSGWEVTYRAGALLTASDGLRLRAAAYSGFRLPTLNELYRPFVVFPVVTRANETLLPERLEGFEAGVDWFPAPGVELSLTAFDNAVDNAIANVTIGPDLRQRRNLGAIDARGLELTAFAEMDALSLAGTVACIDARMRGSGPAAPLDGNRPAQTPEIAASATLAWQPREGARLAATLRYLGAQFESDVETDLLPAATTLDLFARLALADKISLVGRVENLFDEVIVTRNDGGSRDLGVPRTVWIGFGYGF